MQRHHSLFTGLLLLGAASAQGQSGQQASTTGAIPPHNAALPSHAAKIQVEKAFGHLPLSFEPNQGQVDRKVRFLTRSLDSVLSLNASEAIFTLPSQPNAAPKSAKARRSVSKSSVGTLRMQLVGANSQASTLQQQPLEGHVNYFCDRDPHKWHSNIPTFGKVGFHGVYPGVDVVYYGNQEHLEYDFLVAPHADPKQIHLHFAGAKDVRVNAAGELIIRAQGRELTWQKPTVYQQDERGKHAVAAHYRLKRLPNGQAGVSFALGHYDTTRSLVIDPVLTYSTYLGAARVMQNSPGYTAVAIDGSGSAYIATASLGSALASVTKLNASGTAALYTTNLGGINTPIAIVVDSHGSAYVGGVATGSYPTTPGAYKTQTNSVDFVVTKLSPDGSTLAYSTFIGATDGINGVGLAVDSSGSAYITGASHSGFPTTPGAFQPANNTTGNQVVVSKLNPTGSALVYSTYIGGSTSFVSGHAVADYGASIAVDAGGNAYVTGLTSSSDFPTTPGAFMPVCPSNPRWTAFVTKLNATGTALVYSTYVGGSRQQGQSIAVDSSGSAYITGSTSGGLPTTPGVLGPVFKATIPDPGTAFVTKFNPSGSALVYSTYLGGSREEVGNGIAVDGSGAAYVTGWTSSGDFPTTVGAFDRGKTLTRLSSVGFVTKLNPTATGLIYSTLLSGSVGVNTAPSQPGGDSGQSIAVDSSGNAYVSGSAFSTDFPTTPGAMQSAPGEYFAAKLSTAPIFPDFNSDGNTDLLLQNASTGAIVTWFMQGATKVGNTPFSLTPPAEYALVGAGDFSGNGNNTLVLQSSVTNKIALWFTNGTNNATIFGGSFVDATSDAGYKVVGIGDFNADGKSDLVFQSQTTGQIAVWFTTGSHRYGGVLLPFVPATGWSVVGTGDFNKDGFTDLVFQNQTTGQIALWYLNGTTYVGGTVLASVPATGWKVVGVGDYNGDGSADLLFQNSTSSVAAVWYLQNGAFAGGGTLSATLPTGFKIVGPR